MIMRRLVPLLFVASLGVMAAGSGLDRALPTVVTPVGAVWAEGDLWLTPAPVSTPALGAAVAALADGDTSLALATFSRAAAHPIVGGYARLYQGRTELAMNRVEAARASARHVLDGAPSPALREEALWLLAEAFERADAWDEASKALTTLVELPARNVPKAYLRLGRAALKADLTVTAAQSLTKVYEEFPLAPESAEAKGDLERYFHFPPATFTIDKAARRAERLFAGREFEAARKAFQDIVLVVSDELRPRIRLRMAQCDLQLGHYAQARAALATYLDTATERLDEAGYAYLAALRGLRRQAEYVARTRSFVEAHPASALAEAALNDLASYFILANDDAAADAVFREMLAKFPRGAYTERAAWKAGWAAFRAGAYRDTIAIFDTAVANVPRSDYRPSWLYWSARAHERLGQTDEAFGQYRATVAAYRHSYYGRQALTALSTPRFMAAAVRSPGPHVTAADAAPPAPVALDIPAPPSNAALIRALLAAELYDEAIQEIRRAQAEGPSPLVEATLAYALNRKGQLRPAIIAMRRAYPQFMADGGEALPPEILRVIFPVDYWDLIRHYARQRNLDPYLMAALIAQESTFQADVRSRANAWGLMQILPSTGRQIARAIGIRGFTTARLKDPDVNIRIGMKFFQDLLARFDGDVVAALASYNAGDSRVVRWRAERPGLEPDEFIDDIPFPETQNYVKRILGTADDYRRLYGEGAGTVVRQSAR